MGGEDGENYARFKTFCCQVAYYHSIERFSSFITSISVLQSYNWLRKSANLILNLLSLMGDAGA